MFTRPPQPHFLTEWAQIVTQTIFLESPDGSFFVFRNSRFKCVFFRKKRVFLAQEGILFFTHSPGDRTNWPKWTKFGQKLSFRNLQNGFFLFFEIRVLSAFFSKKTRFLVFFPTAPGNHSNRPKYTKSRQKQSLRNFPDELFFVFWNSRFKGVFLRIKKSKKTHFLCF